MSPVVPFMATAVLLLPLLGAGLMWAARDLVTGNFRSWHVLAVNHLTTLGWGMLTAMGAAHSSFRECSAPRCGRIAGSPSSFS